MIEAVERSGKACSDWRARIPLNWALIDHPYSRLEFEEFERVLSAAVAITGDDAFGVHLAEQVSESAIDLLAHLSAHSSTMRHAIEVTAVVADARSGWCDKGVDDAR